MLNLGKIYKRAKYIGFVGLITFFLGGCMSLSDVTGPFKMLGKNQNAKQQVVQKNLPAPPLHISGTTGMPPGWSDRLHMHIENESRKIALPVEKSGSSIDGFQLVGHLSAADISSGTLIAYVWDVQNEKGDKLHRISGQRKLDRKGARGAWSAINDETLRKIGEEAATKLQGWMTAQGYIIKPVQMATQETKQEIQSAPPETSTPSRTKPLHRPKRTTISSPRIKTPEEKKGESKQEKPRLASVTSAPLPAPKKQTGFKKETPKAARTEQIKQIKTPTPTQSPKQASTASFVYIGGVNGARGQGNAELTRAIISSLAKNGLGISPTPQPAGYKLEGKVKIEPAENGRDRVLLSWNIKTADGTLIGTVSQKNEIKSGSFNESWGQTAFLAADAAAGSIKMVIDKRKKQKI